MGQNKENLGVPYKMSFHNDPQDDFDFTPYAKTHSLNSTTPPSTLAAYGVLILLSVYYLTQYLEYAYLPLSELLWNSLVYITPSKMITFIDPTFTSSIHDGANTTYVGFESIHHASKSSAMRRAFGLDGKSATTTVQRSRQISDMGVVFKSKSSDNLPGLGNWDHSCYQNSVIQGLASLRSLLDYLKPSEDGGDGPTTKALRELIVALNEGDNAGKTFWTPTQLKSMSSWQQQDAQEYFSKIMDALEKDAVRLRKTLPQSQGLKFLSAGRSSEPGREQSNDGILSSTRRVQRKNESILLDLPRELRTILARNPLDGLLAQRVGCQKCGHVEGLSLVPFNCLTVPLGRQRIYDVQECLDDYTALESINGVECTRCTLLGAKLRTSQLIKQTVQSQKSPTAEQPESVGIDVLLSSARNRLDLIEEALDGVDFSDGVLKKCMIPSQQHITSTKSRQAVIARPPKALVIHINRSIFDEVTGEQSKNQALVQFPLRLPLGQWCLGSQNKSEIEEWSADPLRSMLSTVDENDNADCSPWYQLRAVVTHYGRHENGHYICYRQSPVDLKDTNVSNKISGTARPWFRLSDEDVSQVSEQTVLAQGGVFMLFYERTADAGIVSVDHAKDPSEDAIINTSEEQTPSVSPASTQPADEPVGVSLTSTAEVEDPVLREHVRSNDETKKERQTPDDDPTDQACCDQTLDSIAAPRRDLREERDTDSALPQMMSEKLDLRDERDEMDVSSEASAPKPPVPLPARMARPLSPRTGRETAGEGGTAMESVAGFVQAN